MNQTKPTYKQQDNVGLFDSDETMVRLNKMGNPLAKLQEAVDFEMFRETLEKCLHREKFTKVGAKPYDYVLMFKIVVLQRMYHLSDAQTEYQIRDRLSFRTFLGLASGDKVPHGKTIWVFKEELTQKGLFEQLFDEFYAFLEENNLIMHEGTMIDGSFVEVPRQRNIREENKQIKEGKVGVLWNPEEGDTEEEKISKWQEIINRRNSKLRVRVEHVFGFREECLLGMSSSLVCFARNAAYNSLTNLIYNLCRYEQFMQLGIN